MGSSTSRAVATRTDRHLRPCPTLPGDLRPLIEHRIGSGQCFERQRELYHKCHRCVYRGKPADYVFDEADQTPAGRNGVLALAERPPVGANGSARRGH